MEREYQLLGLTFLAMEKAREIIEKMLDSISKFITENFKEEFP